MYIVYMAGRLPRQKGKNDARQQLWVVLILEALVLCWVGVAMRTGTDRCRKSVDAPWQEVEESATSK